MCFAAQVLLQLEIQNCVSLFGAAAERRMSAVVCVLPWVVVDLEQVAELCTGKGRRERDPLDALKTLQQTALGLMQVRLPTAQTELP